jgi:Asp-tRNA(Asn)/Glu-tRNA(Gln) amidotransferase B subunit
MTEVLRVVQRERQIPSSEAVPTATEVGALLKMVEEATLSLNAAKTAFAAMCKSGKRAEATSSRARPRAGFR